MKCDLNARARAPSTDSNPALGAVSEQLLSSHSPPPIVGYDEVI